MSEVQEIMKRIEAIPVYTFDEIVTSVMRNAEQNSPLSYSMSSWYRGQLWGAFLMTNGNSQFFDQYQAAEKAIYAMEKP